MYIDLTMEVSEQTPIFPGDPKIKIETIDEMPGSLWNERRVHMNTHVSTHVDAPYHMDPDGKKLEDFPIDYFIGEAVTIDVRGHQKIQAENLGGFQPAPIVLLRTDHSKKAFDEDYFENNPVITEEAAQVLIDQGARIVGIDSFTPDNEPYTVHKMFFEKDILSLENLVNLEKIGDRCNLYISPLNLTNADGAPARVIAEI